MSDPLPVNEWLLDAEHSDPSIRWQAMRDLLDAPHSEWMAERAKVEREGWGARLLALEDEDGQWAGGAYFPGDFDFDGPQGQEPGQPWTATTYSLSQLREFGLDPSSDRAKRVVELVGANSRWEEAGQPYWDGEVEPCVNGMTVANGAYFGVDVSTIVERLVGERLEDGGWNCEAVRGSVRSFVRHHDQRSGGAPRVRARHRRHARVTGGAPVGRGVSPGASAVPPPQHG